MYQDRPATSFPRLQTAVGPGVTTLSVYVGARELVDPRVIALARAGTCCWWSPGSRTTARRRSSGSPTGATTGRCGRLVRQIRGLEPKAILRPMPEPNTPWYAWSGEVSNQGAARYVRAWRHVTGS